MTGQVDWRGLAVCKGIDTNLFYEKYEADPVLAENMDTICFSCPVRLFCLTEGIENQEDGLWGGIFLNKGKPDSARNAHKSDETWATIRESLSNG